VDSLKIHPEFIAPVIVLFSWNMPSSVEKGRMTMVNDPTYQEGTSVAFPELAMKGVAPPEEVEYGTESDGLAAAGVQLDSRSALSERGVSGLYRGTRGDFQLELRVDVDGSRPMNRLSGDLFRGTGATTNYFGSFIVNSPTFTRTASSVTIEGLGEYTWSTEAPRVKVTMSPPAPVTIQFFTISGSPGSIYICPFVSSYFRSVQWEQDSVVGTVPFVSYNTGSLPQPPNSPSRELTVSKAYAEAGIELQTAGLTNIVDTSASGTDTKWSDSELHAAMVSNFSLWEDIPQWKVYLIVATSHVDGWRGIMYDQQGFQRQGCAVFYDAIQGTDAARQRAQLRTYVHELGHCFNLLHSWQKDLADPPAPLGPNGGLGDLSWMNYVQNYQPPPPAPGGEAAYWANFPFQFTDNEIIHLRHAFYRNITFGGNAFGTGAAEVESEKFADPTEDNSGLKLELRSKDVYAYGEPVVAEIKLSTTDLRGKRAHSHLHPDGEMVQIAIRKPSGRTVLYRPMIEHCVDEVKTVTLTSEHPAIYDSAYIGYGKNGFYFDQPGAYQLRAIYIAQDGSRVVSPTLNLQVRSPYTATDEEVGELFMGDEQGQLLKLLGSDSEALKHGNEAFDLVLDKHSEHPLAVYARLVKGINAQRNFKKLAVDKVVKVRDAKPQESVDFLSSVVDDSTAEKGLDNITLNLAMRRLARAQKETGDLERAEATIDRMVDVFEQKQLKPYILQQITADAEAEKAVLNEA
jgi:hypothetical protein